MKYTLFKLFAVACIFGACSAFSQSFIRKETKFWDAYSGITKGYFKNGHNVILRYKNSQKYCINEIDPVKNTEIRTLDSFYSNSPYFGFEFYERNNGLFYERIKTDFTNNQVYLFRKNLTTNQSDSTYLYQFGSQGYGNDLKRFGDTDVVQIYSFDDKLKKNVSSYYVFAGGSAISVITKIEYNYIFGSDYYFYNKQFILARSENNYFKFYIYSIANSKIDSFSFYNYISNSRSLYAMNLTTINGKLVLLTNYTNKDSLYIYDLGRDASTFNLRNMVKIDWNYTFINQSNMTDYIITGNGGGVRNKINYLDNNYNLVVKAELSKTIDQQDRLTHNYFFAEMDTMYFMGTYDYNPEIGILTKIYPAPTGISKMKANGTLSVYPNPTEGNFKITNTGLEDIQFILYDALGHVLISETIGSSSDKTFTINLPPAIYFIKGDNGFNSKMVVK